MPRSLDSDTILRRAIARNYSEHRRTLTSSERKGIVNALSALERDGATEDERREVAEHAYRKLSTKAQPLRMVEAGRVVKALDERLHGELVEEDDQPVEVEHAVEEAEPVPVEEIDNVDDYVAARRAEDVERDRNR
jgi:hypothetical protein